MVLQMIPQQLIEPPQAVFAVVNSADLPQLQER